ESCRGDRLTAGALTILKQQNETLILCYHTVGVSDDSRQLPSSSTSSKAFQMFSADGFIKSTDVQLPTRRPPTILHIPVVFLISALLSLYLHLTHTHTLANMYTFLFSRSTKLKTF
ncbi:hypothetical protein AMECASPLE_033288, partial [Ameca splendens]